MILDTINLECRLNEEKDDGMSFFSKMERKFGKYAINNLMMYILMIYVGAFVVMLTNPGFFWPGGFYQSYLSLNPAAIIRGQVWRLVTFIFYPISSDLIYMVFMGFLYYSIGMSLERVWGSFKFNVYYLMGILGLIIASFVGYFGFGRILQFTTSDLNMTLFLAYAVTFPEMQLYIYFVLPVKVKWLGILYGAIALFNFFNGGLLEKWTILLSFANFILFFLLTRRSFSRLNPKEVKRRRDFQKKVKMRPLGKSHHKCAVCGRTEKDGEDLEFRYCSKCTGDYEYCQDHLYTHQHVTGHENDNIPS